MIIYFIACQLYPPKAPEQERDSSGVVDTTVNDSSGESNRDSASDQGKTILMLTIDTLNRDFVNADLNGERITPTLDELFSTSAYFPNTLVTRGQTSPSLASILTGLYPRSTMVRSNPRVLEADVTTLQERFQNAGYTTIGYSANFCHYIDLGIDIRRCTHPDEEPDLEQSAADALLVDELIETLQSQPRNKDLFIWLHLMDPHDPYRLTEPFFSSFHPQNYSGELQTEAILNLNNLNAATYGQVTLNDADHDYLNAIYASQVRQSDDHIKRVLQTLTELERKSDALIVFGSDHGEELGAHNNYYYHGCSAFNSVTGVHWSFKAPEVAAQTHSGWISATDIAPTIIGLAGLTWEGPVEGQDLSSGLRSGAVSYSPVFAERGTETVAVIFQQSKYILSTVDEFKECTPYNHVPYGFASPQEQIFDLNSDPDEQNNIFLQAPNLRVQGQTLACNWVLEKTWTTPSIDPTHPMVQRCQNLLEQIGNDGE